MARPPLRIEVEPDMLSDRPPLKHYVFVWEIFNRHRRRTVYVMEGRTEHEADQALLAFIERPDVILLESAATNHAAGGGLNGSFPRLTP